MTGMKGLLKNNFYTSIASVKWFSIALLLFAAAILCFDKSSGYLLLVFMLVSIIGYPAITIASLRKEYASKWHKYKLTVPVTRKNIIESYFLGQILWLLAGMACAGACLCLSMLLHGFPFESNMDILMVFTMGVSVSLLIAAIFYPLFHLGGEEKSEVILVLSVLGSVGIAAGAVALTNWILGAKPTMLELLLGAAAILAASITVFAAAYFITIAIFKRKQF